MFKHLLKNTLLFFFTLCNHMIFGQVGVSASYIMPRAELGVVMKPTGFYEISYQFTEQDERFRLVTSVGFINFQTIEDTLRTYGYISGGNGQLLTSGFELYDNYISIPICFKSDYKFIDRALSPIVGLDINLFFNSYYYEQKIDKIISLTENGSSLFVGMHLRGGLLYTASDNIDLELNFGKTATLENGDGNFRFWKVGFGITYHAW